MYQFYDFQVKKGLEKLCSYMPQTIADEVMLRL